MERERKGERERERERGRGRKRERERVRGREREGERKREREREEGREGATQQVHMMIQSKVSHKQIPVPKKQLVSMPDKASHSVTKWQGFQWFELRQVFEVE